MEARHVARGKNAGHVRLLLGIDAQVPFARCDHAHVFAQLGVRRRAMLREELVELDPFAALQIDRLEQSVRTSHSTNLVVDERYIRRLETPL